MSEQATRLTAGGPNAIAVINGIVGDEWTLWIVQTALNAGLTQYNEWLRAGPISSSVLTDRLARLVETGILERARYSDRPPRDHYRLTGRGRQLWPLLLTMWAWERRWVNAPEEHLPQMRHTKCGNTFDPRLRCDACDGPVDVRAVQGILGPSGEWSRSIPAAATRRRSQNGRRPPELIDQTMALIGNRWSAALLGAALLGATRFGEFQSRLGAPPTIVADRLRTFCDLGVLAATRNPDRPDWTVYRLTDKGRDFYPTVACAVEWAQRWFAAPEGPALRVKHTVCGRALHPRLACDQCGQRLRGSTVAVIRGR